MAQGVEVNVLGTHFNVNAYPERTDVVTTLVEGKVRVERGTRQIVLVPGEQAAASGREFEREESGCTGIYCLERWTVCV